MTHQEKTKYVILDLETTGLNAQTSEIIEFGAILVEGLNPIARFQKLVRPREQIPLAIQQLTGISQKIVDDAECISDVIPKFVDFVGDLPIVAHNSSMEASFLKVHVPEKTFVVHNSIEPLALILPDSPSHSMDSLRKLSGIAGENSHRALPDCEDVLNLLNHFREHLFRERQQIGSLVKFFFGKTDWWWKWYFDFESTPELDSPLEALNRTLIGNLRKLAATDKDRQVDFSECASGPQVEQALRSISTDKYSYRESQHTMAEEIREALVEGRKIGIEAPTGTGKSIGYLIPAALAAKKTKAPVVVSTHSKSLQDQLLTKDIPLAAKLIGSDINAVTVKGQENYICLRKLYDLSLLHNNESSLEELFSICYLFGLSSVSETAEIDRVSHYLLQQFPILRQYLDRVRSIFSTTKGPACKHHDYCHFFNAARLAHEADIIIANHALVFHWPAHFPKIRGIVLDEAHHLEDQITDAYSVKLDEETFADALARLSRKKGKHRIGDCTHIATLLRQLVLSSRYESEDPSKILANLTDSLRDRLSKVTISLSSILGTSSSSDGYEEVIVIDSNQKFEQLKEELQALTTEISNILSYLKAGLDACEGSMLKFQISYDVLATHALRFSEFEEALKIFLNEHQENWLRLLYWNRSERTWRFVVSPIDVSDFSKIFFSEKHAAILTSATLSAGQADAFSIARIKLDLAKPLMTLPSPFNLEKQAVVFIPSDISPPNTSGHLDALINFTEEIAGSIGGRTLLLMTSNRRLSIAAERLREKLQRQGIAVFDSVSDKRAADNFRNSNRALLIGSERYGEGLDIPGRTLSCVIIEKINEAMTRSPLAEVRKAQTQFGIYDYDFPLRMIWLRQRIGRLIRSTNDSGAVIIFDSRYNSWSGKSREFVKNAIAPIPLKVSNNYKIIEEVIKAVGV